MRTQDFGREAGSADQELYAVFMSATGLICGIGHTEEAAWAVAKAIERPYEEDVLYDIKPCSREFVQLVMAKGGDISYDERHGTLVTEREATQLGTSKNPFLRKVRSSNINDLD